MSHLITEEQISTYQRDGAIRLRNLFDAAFLETLAEGIEANLRQPTRRSANLVDDPAAGEHFFFDALVLGENPAYDKLILESPAGEVVAQLMRSSKAVLFYMTVFIRSPGTRTRTPWHQDQKSWSASGDQGCSLWMSLDPVPRDTALEFVAGSHRWETDFERPPFFQQLYEADDKSSATAFPDIEADREQYDILAWDLEPGDCLVFHGMTTHGGSGNLPPGLGRRSISIQWLGDDARFRLLEGRDDPHISEELLKFGVKPGDPVISDMCPVVWPRAC